MTATLSHTPLPTSHPHSSFPKEAEIIASDGGVFHAERGMLAAASPTLRDALSRNSTISLPAPSRAIGAFLSLLGGDLVADRHVLNLLPAFLLLRDYDCHRALQYALTTLKVRVMENEACALQAFVVAAHLDDLGLCRTAIVFGDVPSDDDDGEGAALVRAALPGLPMNYRTALAECWDEDEPWKRGNRFVQIMCTLQEENGDL